MAGVEICRLRSLRNSFGALASLGQAGLLSFGSRLAKATPLMRDTDLVHSTVPLLVVDALRRIRPVLAFGHHVERIREIPDLLTVPFGNSYGSYTYRRADAVAVPSEAAAAQMTRRFGVPRAKLQVIPHGIEASTFYPEKIPFEPMHRTDRRTVLYVGPLTARKNVLALVQAFEHLVASAGDVQLAIVGRGPLEERIDRMAAGPALRGKVRRFEKLSDDQLRQAYSSADVFVSASLDEGFGFAAVESMACGTPVVALDTAVNREVLGDAGLLVHDASPLGLADAIRGVLENPEVADGLARRGRARVERQYSWSVAAERYERLYRRLIEMRAGS